MGAKAVAGSARDGKEAATGTGLMDGDIAIGKVRGHGGDVEREGHRLTGPHHTAGETEAGKGAHTGNTQPLRDFRTC